MINSQPASPGKPVNSQEGTIQTKHAGGRPPKLTPEERVDAWNAFKLYIDREPDPTVPGFLSYDPIALQYNLYEHNLYDWTEFSSLIKRAVKKQEAYLLTGATTNRLNPTLAIFRLKQPQHGYTDKVEQEQTVRVVTPLMQLEQGKERKVIDAVAEGETVDDLLGDE